MNGTKYESVGLMFNLMNPGFRDTISENREDKLKTNPEKALAILTAIVDDKVNKTIEKKVSPALIQSQAKWPFKPPFPKTMKVTGVFGELRENKEGNIYTHQGLDIAAPKDLPVYAINNGIVIKVSYDTPDYGNAVVYKDVLDNEVLMGHLKSVLVKIGDSVNINKRIGSVGNTGTSTGFHLHIGIRKLGSFIDPLAYMELPSNLIFDDTAIKRTERALTQHAKTVVKSSDNPISYALTKNEVIPSVASSQPDLMRQEMQKLTNAQPTTTKEETPWWSNVLDGAKNVLTNPLVSGALGTGLNLLIPGAGTALSTGLSMLKGDIPELNDDSMYDYLGG